MPRFKELIQPANRSFVHSEFGVEWWGPTEEKVDTDLGRGIVEEEKASNITNHEDAPAFERGLYERTVQVLTTNTLSETFYASKSKITAETLQVLEQMRQQDPEFLAKALIYARNEGLLQFVPTAGLVALSTIADKTLFKKAFPQIIITPDNLREFVGLCKTGQFRKGFGGVATKAVKEWLQGLSEYHTLKYSGDAKSTKGKNNISLRDVVRMARPNPKNPELEQRLGWLVKRNLTPEQLDKNPQLAAFEQLKKAQTDEERVVLIGAGRLPWEVVIPAVPKMTREIWSALLHQMPYMALLRNINNFRKHGVLDADENVTYIVTRLTDQQAIKKSKILPFRFYDAYIAYTGQVPGNRPSWDDYDDDGESYSLITDSRIVAALETALELSFQNLPEIAGTIAIGSDVSGSMNSRINPKGKTRYIDICGVLTGALLKKATGRVYPLPFAGSVVKVDLSGQDRILETTNKLSKVNGGCTALGAPIQQLLDRKQKVDVFIGITDGEDWAYNNGYGIRGSFLKLWRTYQETVNPNAQAFLVRIDPYKTGNAPQGEAGVHFIYGWSDQVLNFIANTLKGNRAQVEAIKQLQL